MGLASPVPGAEFSAPSRALPGSARDRYVDALRVGSLAVVIIGHWLMANVDTEGRVSNALVYAPRLQPLTWLLQVMPLFFLVGGVAHAYALAALDRRGVAGPGRYAIFIGVRARRLLLPTSVLIGVWVGIGLLLRAVGATQGSQGPLVLTALRLVTQPLWFVGIYLGVAALAPAMAVAHRRWGAWVVVGLVMAVGTVDWLRFGLGLQALATLNYALVWLAIHQLGLSWHSGLLTRGAAVAMAAAASATLVVCVTLGPYPISMVGLPGERLSNMSPPTLALLAQGFTLAGIAVLLRGPVARLLTRPRVWRTVVTMGAVTMTAFLWHLTSLFIAVLGMRVFAIRSPEPTTSQWWLTRPVWLLVLTALTVVLVAIFRRFDSGRRTAVRPSPPVGSPARAYAASPNRGIDAIAAIGAATASLGVLMVSMTGIDVLGSPTVHFIAVNVTPTTALAVLAAGILMLILNRPSGTDRG